MTKLLKYRQENKHMEKIRSIARFSEWTDNTSVQPTVIGNVANNKKRRCRREKNA